MTFWLARINNYRYRLGLLIGCVIVTIHLVTILPVILPQINGRTTFFTPYTQWLSMNLTGLGVFYFMAIPILASLSSAQIISDDLRSGFFWQINRHKKIWQYALTTQLIAAISGALTVMLPLALDFIVLWCVLPNITPNIFLNYGNSIFPGLTFFADLYYTHPALLVMIYLLISGVVGAGFAVFSSLVAVYINNRFATLSAGFVISMMLTILAVQSSNPMLQSPVLLASEIGLKAVPNFMPTVLATIIGFIIMAVIHYLGVKRRFNV
ncbi:hypothetical protein [Periweissella ghanensis]|uniref:ABC transporter permease n=1 Tax=Periweissella ghanensis TaxID=467997 RepID=A0ABN8BNE8_9LACO|nr:hypothetical protein [Periweissella ghanensis]MCM0600834.1 hypothetical protein [Periweissella ghanensis]CAH0417750.1 hypothetical protein WGH24286_00162 [Periweissella ghanensis]